MKRLLSVFLALALIVGFAALPAGAPAANAADSLLIVDFENGGTGGFTGQGSAKLTVTAETAHSGKSSLLVTGRTAGSNGPVLKVDQYITEAGTYEISVWVSLKTPNTAPISLTTRIGSGSDVRYRRIREKTISKENWVEFKGKFAYGVSDIADGALALYVESDNNTAEFYIDDMSIRRAEDGVANAARLPSLKEAYQDHFLIGNIFSPGDINDIYLSFFKRHYDILTAGGAMKSDALTTAKGTYAFTAVDAALKTILAEGLQVHGHTLLWHEASARWLNQDVNGKPLTRAEAKANLEAYVNAVAGHYAGQLRSWDVLNEAMRDLGSGEYRGNWKDALRGDGHNGGLAAPWHMAYANGADTASGESGADYVYDAFALARKADPAATLYYNDFNEDNQDKFAAVADMVETLNGQWKTDPRNTEPGRPLIEGVGLQGHYSMNTDPAKVESTIRRLIELDVELSVSELDIALFGYGLNTSWTRAATPELLEKQAELYAKFFQLFKKYGQHIDHVTFWGIDDGTSWLAPNYPLLFDEDFNPKLAYFAVIDPEGYLAGNFDTAGKREKWIQENTSPLSTASAWARDAITSAIDKGFVPEDVQGDYQANITRAEFCRMAVMYIEYKTGRKIDGVLSEKGLAVDPKTFDDTGDPYILAAYALGVTSGTAPGQFNPGGQFDRQSAAQMIANVHAVLGHDVSGPEPAGFADADKISPWTKAGVDYCAASGIMRGNDNQFDPAAPFSREMSVMTFDNMK